MGRKPGRPARPSNNVAPTDANLDAMDEAPRGFPKVPGTPIGDEYDATPPPEAPPGPPPQFYLPDDEATGDEGFTPESEGVAHDGQDEATGVDPLLDEARWASGPVRANGGDEADRNVAKVAPGDAESSLFLGLVDRLAGDIPARADRTRAALETMARDYAEGRISLQVFTVDATSLVARLESDEADISNLSAIQQDPGEVWTGFQTPLVEILRRLAPVRVEFS